MYDINMETINYSSSGPTYELVDTDMGAGQTHSVLEQSNGRSSNTANTLTTEDEGHHYHVLESGGFGGVPEGWCGGVPVEACDYEVPVSQQTHSRVWLCEEEYSTLKH